MADSVVYQSNFARDWWQTRYHDIQARSQVIYNGVDLHVFTPQGVEKPPKDSIHVLVIEGSFSGGYDTGLQNAVEFAHGLSQINQRKVKLNIIGQVPEDVVKNINQTYRNLVHWMGRIPHKKIPAINRQAHMLFSADINAACPNTVIEAIACGLPVIAYATGSLPELIQGDAGRTAPYGSDYWKLEPPNPQALVQAAMEILADQPHFRTAARAHAERHFSLEKMTEQYLAVLRI
jgi:glycosyltransferase involved in cell wall biosynthesis